MTAAGSAVPIPARKRRRRLMRKRFLRRPAAVAALAVIVGFALVAAFAPVVAPQTARATDFDHVVRGTFMTGAGIRTHRVVPALPDVDWDEPHGRDAVG